MKKRIHCGLCSQTLNGLKLRKVPALEGGGVRSIPWDKTDLTFAEVHEQFRGKFKLDSDERTSIYDFQLNLLDLNRYNTFKDYIDDYGLTGKTTAIHLFLHNSGRHQNKSKVEKSSSSKSKKKSSSKVKSIQNSDRENIPQSSFRNHQSITPDYYLRLLNLDYSFIRGIDKLVKSMRTAIGGRVVDDARIQLYKYFCSIRNYTFSTIYPVKKQLKQPNGYSQMDDPSKIELYSNNLLSMDKICQSIKTLIDDSKNQWRKKKLFRKITIAFSEFDRHLQILRNRWSKNVPTASSFSGPCVRSTLDRHIQSVPDDHDSQTVPSYTSQRSTNNEINEKSDLFQPMLTCLKNLLNLLHPERRSIPHGIVISRITEIKSLQSNINLCDKQSLCDAEQEILIIVNLVNQKFYVNHYDQSNSELNQQIAESFKQILKAIPIFLISLHRYKLQLEQNSQENPN